jgi:hypothetical protein
MNEMLESHDRPELSLLRAKIWVGLFSLPSCNLIVNNQLRSLVISESVPVGMTRFRFSCAVAGLNKKSAFLAIFLLTIV